MAFGRLRDLPASVWESFADTGEPGRDVLVLSPWAELVFRAAAPGLSEYPVAGEAGEKLWV